MKIVFDRRIPDLEEGLVRYAEMAGFPIVLVPLEGNAIGRGDVRDADVLFVRTRTRCDASLLGGSRVRLVGTATIGTDHIDIPWCHTHAIKVVNAPGCNAPAVMQYVASSLNVAGFDPSVHTLGVVGKGHIGSLVTRLYRDAGAKVLVSDPPRLQAGADDEDYRPLEYLLQRCDALTFHVPYTTSGPYPTHRLLDGPLPDNIKMVVNASRGYVVAPEIVSPSRRFIIDTWPFEDRPDLWTPDMKSDLIARAFIATPHIAGYSFEGKGRATAAMLAALGADINGEPPEVRIPPLREVIGSFDPRPLSEELKSRPSSFEELRGSHLRHEA